MYIYFTIYDLVKVNYFFVCSRVTDRRNTHTLLAKTLAITHRLQSEGATIIFTCGLIRK